MPAKLSAVGLLVLGLVAGTLALPALSPPAAAVGVFAGVSWTTPVTWVDGAGRQYVTVTTGAANGDGWPTLRIARDLADGTPDASWGTVGGTDGLAEVAFEPPTSGVAMNPNVAAADDGTLSVAWRESTCSGDACWRWFSRHDGATGARIGTAVDRSSGVALARQLDDGTWLGHDGGALVRIDGAGAALGVPALASDDVAAADPTASGDLLTIDLTATLRRTPAGGGADDLTLATGCATAYAGTSLGGFAVGAAPGGGFAVACRPAVGGPLTVTSYDAAGVEQWTTPTTSPDIELAYPDRVTVDADGRVWVAGRSSGTGVVPSPGVATLGSYTEAGDELVDYARSTGTSLENGMDVSGTGIRDLRTVGPDHIAFADLKLCCRYPNNTSISNSVYGQTFPKAPTPPTCEGPRPRLAVPSTTSLEVTFDACDHQPVERQPTGYRVELSGEAGASTTTVAHVEGMGPQTVTI
ncbi:MAG: hypothetical protein KDA98_04955, partial [Acidimicrobiales bacterium]|nr:hypothetical protein [Acidimicrobiales bacterium]